MKITYTVHTLVFMNSYIKKLVCRKATQLAGVQVMDILVKTKLKQ